MKREKNFKPVNRTLYTRYVIYVRYYAYYSITALFYSMVKYSYDTHNISIYYILD